MIKYRKKTRIKPIKKSNLYRVAKASKTKSNRRYFVKKRVFRFKFFIYTGLFLLLLISIIYFFCFSNIFKIKNTNIVFLNNQQLVSKNELNNIVNDLLKEKYLYFLPRNNIIFFKRNNLQNLLWKDPRIAFMSVNKKFFPASLNIEIGESKPAGKLFILGDDNVYYLNLHGQIIASFSTQKNNNKKGDEDLPLIYDKTSTDIKNAEITELFKNILDFIKDKSITKIHINKIEISEQGGIFDIKMITNQGWQIFINSEMDFNKQLSTLDVILNEKLENTQNLEHIDLRFDNRIFYKLLNTQKIEL